MQDVIIIGAGAAGLMCALQAGARGRRVLLLDHGKAVGEKIRISGGGRCNFTNMHTTPKNFLSQNPYFAVSALKRYGPADFIALVEKHDIAYHEKTLGQLFCDGSSKQIIAMLLAECEAVGVNIRLGVSVVDIQKRAGFFALETSDKQSLKAESVVIATGGPSIPKMGATGWGYDVARKFGLKVVTPRAALVPFTLAEHELANSKTLAGVAFNAVVICGDVAFEEGMLFTHRGLSGPSILQISSYWREGQSIEVDMLPAENVLERLKQAREAMPKQEIQTILVQYLPKKLAHYLCERYALYGRMADCSNARLQEIADYVSAWKVTPQGTEGYRTAEVALGGVDTDELSSKTMESKAVEGLYFIGEVVDVTGHLGGFNFQWAWSSAYAAGQYV